MLARDILKTNYFPNLDGLRFIAALMVIIHHIELYKSLFGLHNYYATNRFISISGKLGVVLFFVLSGFLIFSLLLKEKAKNGFISTKLFYYRRILRIWPLYYLILCLGLFVWPHVTLLNVDLNYAQSRFLGPFLYSVMLPNVACVMYIIIPFVSQVWSLGIEEQIYIVSPIILKFTKRAGLILASIVVITVILKFIFWYLSPTNEEWMKKLYYFNNFSYSCIAIGGLTSFLYFEKQSKFFNVFFHRWFQVILWTISILLISFGTFFKVYQFELFSLLFALIILNLACNKRTIVSLDVPLLNYLGKISFGLYMYHPIIIVLVLKLLLKFDIYNFTLTYALVIFGTILTADLSYRFFESRFLRMRNSIQVYK